MQFILKAPTLITTNYWKDLCFKQVALHDDDWKFIKNEKITDEILSRIKELKIYSSRFEEDKQEVIFIS